MKEDFCDVCNSQLCLTNYNGTSVHYGRLDCPKCGFKGFARNPESPKIGTTQEKRIGKITIEDVLKIHNYSEEFCFMCLRKKNQLGVCETLTKDHIMELSEGGRDEPENMQILCSACHKIKNWLRLYLHWHIEKRNNDGDTKTT